MFLCRRFLIPAHIPRHFQFRNSILRYNSNATVASSHARVDRSIRPRNIPLGASGATVSVASVETHTLLRRLSEERTDSMESGSSERERGAGISGISELDAYNILRGRERSLFNRLPGSSISRIIRKASHAKSSDLINYLALDLVDIFIGSKAERVQLIETLLLTTDIALLRPESVLAMLNVLELAGSLHSLSQQVVERLTRMLVGRPISLTADKALLETITPLFLSHLKGLRVPPGAQSVSYHPPHAVKVSFGLIQRLLAICSSQRALDVFQVLVETRSIPPEALQETNHQSKDFSFIICSTLVRACLHWHWPDMAATLLLGMVPPEDSNNISTPVADLAVDTMYVLLESPSIDDIATCACLLRKFYGRVRSTVFPDGLIRQFYISAHQSDQGGDAESVYAFVQSVSVRHKRPNPVPQGSSLTWLLEHVTKSNENSHLGRTLVTQVAEGGEPIPLPDRARFIRIAALNGYAMPARILWERYSIGRDKDAVVGNAATMIRMISLFAKIIKDTQAELEALRDKRHHGDGPADTHLNLHILQRRLQDVTGFANRVVLDFRQTREPIDKGDHYALTSLSRALILLGRLEEALGPLKILLDRNEIPDLHDINVTLSALAEYNPRGAARMIERMIAKGVQPDPVTFGTVIHHALAHHDTMLVDGLIKQARQRNGHLSIKTVVALVRASVIAHDKSITSQKANLRRALVIAQDLANEKYLSSSIGKDCIFASLRVNEPVIAYRFWKLLVADKTDWNDREQRFQRRLIARMIRKHLKNKWMASNQATLILTRLREEREMRGMR